jgi:hypothetical protein
MIAKWCEILQRKIFRDKNHIGKNSSSSSENSRSLLTLALERF